MKQAVRPPRPPARSARAATAVPALVRRRQGSAHADRDRRASISMAAAAVQLAERIFPTICATSELLFIGAGEMIELCATHFAAQQPKSMTVANRTLERGRDARARASAPTRSRWRAARAPGRVRHRRLLHRELAADHRPGHARARAEGAPAPADVHGRPRRAARHRARGRGARRRLPLHRRRPAATSSRTACRCAPRRCAQAEAIIDDAGRAASCTGSTGARSVPMIRALRGHADALRAARARARAKAARRRRRRRSRCSRRCRAA